MRRGSILVSLQGSLSRRISLSTRQYVSISMRLGQSWQFTSTVVKYFSQESLILPPPHTSVFGRYRGFPVSVAKFWKFACIICHVIDEKQCRNRRIQNLRILRLKSVLTGPQISQIPKDSKNLSDTFWGKGALLASVGKAGQSRSVSTSLDQSQ